ncbi:hypothetical protein AX774_g6377 [Zancudomyces culisetae]|uniref:Uncharacterized protein n=1 Tax=Zancudomyces culisetae TaxID=1213189 RepID=A0A1R1PH57_ZANCU|nr:hypothetical protein AX774_g6377 [Zancudomyces culisetae]|eukprot:OMH80192.1 hypothetical protein AX774_g6377 [Zancudomyces culisetae]
MVTLSVKKRETEALSLVELVTAQFLYGICRTRMQVLDRLRSETTSLNQRPVGTPYPPGVSSRLHDPVKLPSLCYGLDDTGFI